ncbi:MAG: YitT family protein, partial [Brachymonas sp.]|nr:YitT family protein [Brachymonas sp.]MBP6967032.1 YitT family protein [Brachymonas sp.]MBP7734214.1 YitT family protein [Brachymonas sp.]MBP7743841.1 YitT family protein [Brachymonas sp.]MBP8597302.1 YitT family protein [Brachymonas sp.]
MKNQKHVQALQYLYVLCGTALMAFAVVCFVSPNNLVTGGGTGLALILHYLFSSLSVGTLLLFVSVPFVLLGFFYFGKQYTIKTFFALFSTTFFID